MNQIEQIIETVLDAHRDAGTHDNPQLAQLIASKLVTASLHQLAAVTGGTIINDASGQVVICSGHYDEDIHYDNLASNQTPWS
jgi:hypothetical protein